MGAGEIGDEEEKQRRKEEQRLEEADQNERNEHEMLVSVLVAADFYELPLVDCAQIGENVFDQFRIGLDERLNGRRERVTRVGSGLLNWQMLFVTRHKITIRTVRD